MPSSRAARAAPAVAVLVVIAATLGAGYLLRPPDPAPRHARPRPAAPAPDTDVVAVTWIGHATALIRIHDRWFLTDPVLGDRIARLYPRKVRAGIDPDHLPRLTAVLVSHAHFDHLDTPSLQRVEGDLLVVPPDLTRHLPGDLRFAQIEAVDTWQTVEVVGDHGVARITAVPARHSSARWGLDVWRDHGHTGWVIEYAGHTVYFAGDTGLDLDGARALAARFDIDVALMPVGPAGRPRWVERLRRHAHVTPTDALAMFAASGAQWMVPVHFGTFFKTLDHELPHVEAAIAAHPAGDRVRLIGIGDTTEFYY